MSYFYKERTNKTGVYKNKRRTQKKKLAIWEVKIRRAGGVKKK